MSSTVKNMDFQEKLVSDLQNNPEKYSEASIYTVLFDLVKGSSLNEVVTILHNLASDLGLRKEIEEEFDRSKNYEWH